jgi:hypothetical protein
MACQKELRIVTAYTSIAGVRQNIFVPPGGEATVIEITIQPNATCHLQLFEGSGLTPMSLQIEVGSGLIWSAPAANPVTDTLQLSCLEGGVDLQVEVRYYSGSVSIQSGSEFLS